MSDPRPYMIGREEVVHYRHAFHEAVERFRMLDPAEMAARSGAGYDPGRPDFHG